MATLNVVEAGRMDYASALELQERTLRSRRDGTAGDTLILVEHDPVLTLGRRGDRANILLSAAELAERGVEVFEVSRGGDVTYHGPGQLVGYPVIDLRGMAGDVKGYVRNIEEVFIRLLEREYGIKAYREDKKYTGVWVDGKKIVAIGIAVRELVTMHGFAFNVNTDMDAFGWINPCGITDRGVTSLSKIVGREMDFAEVTALVERYFREVFE
jgi:lipoyl(octanoyl) transferase